MYLDQQITEHECHRYTCIFNLEICLSIMSIKTCRRELTSFFLKIILLCVNGNYWHFL